MIAGFGEYADRNVCRLYSAQIGATREFHYVE